jgi:hypothetical protein
MRHLTPGARLLAVLAIPVAVASVALGAGAASASTTTPASGVTWHKLSAINGWHSAQHAYKTGDPRWALKGGVVYLSGSVRRSSVSSNPFAVLPLQARPSHAMWITVSMAGHQTGTLTILPSGKMYASSTPSGYAPFYTSLAAVSFPAKSTAKKKITPLNGWHSEQSVWNSGDPSYTVKNGVVYLSGSLATSGTNHQFALLPKAARPAHNEYITVYTFNGTHGTVFIGANGQALAYSGSATSFTSLASVSYPVASAPSHKLTLQGGWHSEQGVYNTGDPAYEISGGVVYLSGSLATGGTNDQFAVLPPAARPAHRLYIKAYTFASSVGTVLIEPNGTMAAYNADSLDSQKFTSLATISFPLTS